MDKKPTLENGSTTCNLHLKIPINTSSNDLLSTRKTKIKIIRMYLPTILNKEEDATTKNRKLQGGGYLWWNGPPGRLLPETIKMINLIAKNCENFKTMPIFTV